MFLTICAMSVACASQNASDEYLTGQGGDTATHGFYDVRLDLHRVARDDLAFETHAVDAQEVCGVLLGVLHAASTMMPPA